MNINSTKIIPGLLALLVSAGTFAQSVDKVTLVFYYPPGGNTEQAAEPLIEHLTQTGISVDKKFTKSCSDALAVLAANDTQHFLVSYGSDLGPNTNGTCESFSSLEGKQLAPKYVSPITTSSFYVCTAPSKPQLTIDDLVTGAPTIAVTASRSKASGATGETYFSNLAARPIPYATGAELRAAVTSGDVDFVFTSGLAPAFIAQGAKCVAATTKDNALKVPFLGDVVQVPTETTISMHLWSNRPLTVEVTSMLQDAFNALPFQRYLTDRNGFFEHHGIGTGITVEEATLQFKPVD